jgi:hypothetical protein
MVIYLTTNEIIEKIIIVCPHQHQNTTHNTLIEKNIEKEKKTKGTYHAIKRS